MYILCQILILQRIFYKKNIKFHHYVIFEKITQLATKPTSNLGLYPSPLLIPIYWEGVSGNNCCPVNEG